jgi:DNA mismatch repair protein MSH5
MLLTGPNFSGKSVYLKQVAIIVFLAQIGSFVPAETATIGLVDQMFTRIHSKETVSKMQSAFLLDLQQVTKAMHGATEHSLVLMDEFGKGTQTADGIALFCATLQHFMDRGSGCPRVMATTHFHGMKRRLELTGW